MMFDGEVFFFLEAIWYPVLCPCSVGLQDPKSRQKVPGGDEVTCGTCLLLHLATMNLCLEENSWREDKQLMWFWRRAWTVPGRCEVCLCSCAGWV